ncbi:MAG: hypothetical protein ACYTGQ_11475 [Planctomycetota bacterium]|jgi:hypothetical protein
MKPLLCVLWVGVWGIAAAGQDCHARSPDERPNVIILYADGLGCADPAERVDVATDHPDVVARLKKLYHAIHAQTPESVLRPGGGR